MRGVEPMWRLSDLQGSKCKCFAAFSLRTKSFTLICIYGDCCAILYSYNLLLLIGRSLKSKESIFFTYRFTAVNVSGTFCAMLNQNAMRSDVPMTIQNAARYVSLKPERIPLNFIQSNCWIPCQSVPLLFSLVGVLWRTKQNTIDAILIQWDANKWQGILQLSPLMTLGYLKCLALCDWFYLLHHVSSLFAYLNILKHEYT